MIQYDLRFSHSRNWSFTVTNGRHQMSAKYQSTNKRVPFSRIELLKQ